MDSRLVFPKTAWPSDLTHHDLRQLITQGLFREDLYFRLNVVPIRLPPLRERQDDIPQLLAHFLGRFRSPNAPGPRR